MTLTARDDRPNFNLIAVVEHLVFGDEIVSFNHQMCLNDEIQLTQEFLDLFGAFDFDGSGWMAQLDLHARMIRPALAGLQESVQQSMREASAPLTNKRTMIPYRINPDPQHASQRSSEPTGGMPRRLKRWN